jgi:hypothetical protein
MEQSQSLSKAGLKKIFQVTRLGHESDCATNNQMLGMTKGFVV